MTDTTTRELPLTAFLLVVTLLASLGAIPSLRADVTCTSNGTSGYLVEKQFKITQGECNNGATALTFGIRDKDANNTVDNWKIDVPMYDNLDRCEQTAANRVDVKASGAAVQKGSQLKIDVDWYYHEKHCGNQMQIRDVSFTCADGTSGTNAIVKATPNHAWGIDDPLPVPGMPSLWMHSFHLVNTEDFPGQSFFVKELKFLVTADLHTGDCTRGTSRPRSTGRLFRGTRPSRQAPLPREASRVSPTSPRRRPC